MTFKQVNDGRWPSGRSWAIGVLTKQPDEIENVYGIVFTRKRDDLDAFAEAGVQLPSGRIILLMKYDGDAMGTTVFADAADDVEEARAELVSVFGGKEIYIWKNMDTPGDPEDSEL